MPSSTAVLLIVVFKYSDFSVCICVISLCEIHRLRHNRRHVVNCATLVYEFRFSISTFANRDILFSLSAAIVYTHMGNAGGSRTTTPTFAVGTFVMLSDTNSLDASLVTAVSFYDARLYVTC
jgi:hypothetical protein